MKARTHSILLWLTASSFLMLASCEQSGEEEATPSVQSEEPSHPWDIQPSSEETKNGKEIYLSECAMCHNEGEEGAPALTNEKQWDQRATKGFETLVSNATNGFIGEDGEMPARGGSELTDTQVKDTVSFMLEATGHQ